MPSVISEFGANRQFDIVSMIDQETFLKKKSKAAINGFSIDEHGKITGTLNLMSYLKVAPRDMK